jgi:hypothetical protein
LWVCDVTQRDVALRSAYCDYCYTLSPVHGNPARPHGCMVATLVEALDVQVLMFATCLCFSPTVNTRCELMINYNIIERTPNIVLFSGNTDKHTRVCARERTQPHTRSIQQSCKTHTHTHMKTTHAQVDALRYGPRTPHCTLVFTGRVVHDSDDG